MPQIIRLDTLEAPKGDVIIVFQHVKDHPRKDDNCFAQFSGKNPLDPVE